MPRAKKGTVKKAGRKSLTPNTLERLRAYGYRVEKTEYWSPFPKPYGRRVDLFDCIDVLGLNPITNTTIGVQSTSRQATSARIKKIKELVAGETEPGECLAAWLRLGHLLEVWGWDLLKGRKRLLKVRLALEDGEVVEAWRKDVLPGSL